MPVLKNYKKDFPWFDNNKNLVYLDNAATTLKPMSMIKAVNEYYEKLSANPHSDNDLAIKVKKGMDETRKLLAKYLEADISEVFFTSGSTESVSLVANAMLDILNDGDEIVLTYLEHDSDAVPWLRLQQRKNVKLVFVGKDSTFVTAQEIKNALTPKTRLVCFTGASNLLADEVDIRKVVDTIKSFNPKIFVLCDTTQYIEHFPVRCHYNHFDFAVGSGHKMIAPTGTGFLYIKKEWYDIMTPLKYGGDMNSEISETGFKYAAGPHKFEGGTPNAAGLYAWKESLKYLLAIGADKIIKRERDLKEYFLKHMPTRSDFVLYSKSPATPLITFNFIDKEGKPVDFHSVERYFAKNNIVVRGGLASASLAKYPLHVDGVIRASMLFYNDYEDIDRLIQVLNKYPKH